MLTALIIALSLLEQAPYLLRQDRCPAIHRTLLECMALAGQVTALWFLREQKIEDEYSDCRIYAGTIRDPLFWLIISRQRIQGCTVSLLVVVELLHAVFPLNPEDFSYKHTQNTHISTHLRTISITVDSLPSYSRKRSYRRPSNWIDNMPSTITPCQGSESLAKAKPALEDFVTHDLPILSIADIDSFFSQAALFNPANH